MRPLAKERWFRGFRFPNLASGLESMRLILRRDLRPSVLRLYDEFDTVITKTGSTQEELQDSVLKNLAKKISPPLSGLFRFSLTRLLMAPRLLNRAVNLLPMGCLLVVVQEGL